MSQALSERARTFDVLFGGGRSGQRQYGRGRSRVQQTPTEEEAAPPPRHWATLLGYMELADRIQAIWMGGLGLEVPEPPEPLVEQPADREPVWSVPVQFKAPELPSNGQFIDHATIAMQRMNFTLACAPAEGGPNTVPAAAPENGNASAAASLPMLHLAALAVRAKPRP